MRRISHAARAQEGRDGMAGTDHAAHTTQCAFRSAAFGGSLPGRLFGATVKARSATRGRTSAVRTTAVDLWIIISVPFVLPLVPRKVGPVVCWDASTVPMTVRNPPAYTQCIHLSGTASATRSDRRHVYGQLRAWHSASHASRRVGVRSAHMTPQWLRPQCSYVTAIPAAPPPPSSKAM